MRASRLISILTLLQAQGRVTAQAMADACEVSLRTIYRDVDALSAAGIPVYGERGTDGGYRLLDGYRTRLNGLSPQEAEALFMAGLAGPAADLGLGTAMAAARLKLLAALPQTLRTGAERVGSRFHLDAPAWFAEPEQPDYLTAVAEAVWNGRPIRMRYRSWKAETERRVEPLGIVLKGGSWYLVGRVGRDIRTYRVSRILDLTVLDGTVERPEGFDLPAYWAESTRRLEAELQTDRATVRLSPEGVRLLDAIGSRYVRTATELADEADEAGWRVARMPIGTFREAVRELLRFGAEAEVLDPPQLRTRLAEAAAGMARLYRVGDANGIAGPGGLMDRGDDPERRQPLAS